MTWSCARCTLQNEQGNLQCSACGLPKVDSRPLVGPKPAAVSGGGSDQHPARPPRDEHNSWLCSVCSYRNEGTAVCEVCNAPKNGKNGIATNGPSSSSSPAAPPRPPPAQTNGTSTANPPAQRASTSSSTSTHWQCPRCPQRNAASLLLCSQCEYRRQTWNCAQCTLENAIGKARCQACTAPNPTRPKLPAIAASTSGSTPPKNPASNGATPPKPLPDQQKREPFSPRIESSVMERLFRDDEVKAKETLNRILTYCRTQKTNFVDDEFPPTDRSIGHFPSDEMSQVPNRARPRNLVWLRPADIFTKDGRQFRWAVFRDPHPTDIEQGVLGNCWFLSALAVIAERPDLLEHIVLSKVYSPEGVYQIRLCVDGRWRVVTVDDHFPCYQNRSIAFTVGRRNQLWVPLIEKALAKVVGGYATLRAGRSVEGLAVLTGAPCELLSLEGRASNTGDEETIDTDLVWATLLSAREAGFLMGCSCGAGQRQLPDAAYDKVGLLSRHAYSLLDVRELAGFRLVRLRNPWGQFVWKGDWSDKAAQWTPELRRLLMPDGPQAGVFWMPFQDFCFYFDSVDICKVRTVVGWKELRLPGVLPPHWLGSHSQATRLIVTEPTEVTLTLYQEEARRDNKDQLDLMILLVREGLSAKSVGEFVLKSKRKVAAFVGTRDAFLSPGSYLVLSCSFNHWGTTSVPKSVLAVHSSKAVLAENIHVPPTVLADALIALVLAEGKMHTALPGTVPRYMSQGFGGLILVMDNLMEDRCVQVQCSCVESNNVVSTRGAMVLVDTIPPLHRQILVILSHFEPSQSFYVQHRIQHRVTMHSGLRDWAPAGVDKTVNHWPPLNENVHGLHSPRPLFTF